MLTWGRDYFCRLLFCKIVSNIDLTSARLKPSSISILCITLPGVSTPKPEGDQRLLEILTLEEKIVMYRVAKVLSAI
jgi:hypothetical protein